MKSRIFAVSSVARDVLYTTFRKMHWREVTVKQIEKILAPTDLSESSLPGLRYAFDLAESTGAEVTVLRVFESYKEFLDYGEEVRKQAARDPAFRVAEPHLPFDEFKNIAGLNDELESQTALRQFLEKHFSGLLASVRIREKVDVGRVDKKIIEQAKKNCTDLIVMSTPAKTSLADVLLGNLSQIIVRDAPCPVLSIRAEPEKKNAEYLRAA